MCVDVRITLQAVESKCDTQRAINQRLEERVMYLTNKLDELERVRIPRSPDGSVHDGSVSVSSAGSAAGRLLGLSPPLADVMRAADRATSYATYDTVEMRNLQLIAEQAEASEVESMAGEGR